MRRTSCSATGALRRTAGVPHGAQVLQVLRGGFDWRKFGHFVRRLPGQDRRGAVGRGVGEPGFGGDNQAGWTLRAALARQFADDEFRLRLPWQREAALGKIELSGHVEKRRQQACARPLHWHSPAAEWRARRWGWAPRRPQRRRRPAPSWWFPGRCQRCISPTDNLLFGPPASAESGAKMLYRKFDFGRGHDHAAGALWQRRQVHCLTRQPRWRRTPRTGGAPTTLPISLMAAGSRPAGTVTGCSSSESRIGSSVT